ncbi:hypothetical protein SDC9_139231 [bioreactor metagenome]|uniref:Uncharacterized protein n=1 Tax=bioreactor metagenome TaxID=1076179 RepID=A0A645DRY5_9ZZZZ
MKKKLHAYGIETSPGNSGMFEGKGITAFFNWDGETNLVIEIKDRPLDTYCGQVSGKLKAFMRECQGF